MFSAAIAPSAANVSVFAAPITLTASLAVSASSSAECLWGIVTFAPTNPAGASARTVSAKRSGGTGSSW